MDKMAVKVERLRGSNRKTSGYGQKPKRLCLSC